MHKPIFTWFGNLPTSTELQGFHYYQGRIHSTKLRLQYFLSLIKNTATPLNKTLITQSRFLYIKMGQIFFPGGVALGPLEGLSMSTPAWACQLKPPLHGLSLSKSPIKKPHNIIWVRLWSLNRIKQN